MATSITDICNGALALMGGGIIDRAWLSNYESDTGPTADWCRILYGKARRRAQRKWDFDETKDYVAGTDAGTDVDGVNHPGYDHAYLIPANPQTLVCRGIVDDDRNKLAYHKVGQYIHCNYATSEFYWDLVLDLETTALFSDGLIRCIEYELAILLCGPIFKGDKALKMCQALILEYEQWALPASAGENQLAQYDEANECADDAWYEVTE